MFRVTFKEGWTEREVDADRWTGKEWHASEQDWVHFWKGEKFVLAVRPSEILAIEAMDQEPAAV